MNLPKRLWYYVFGPNVCRCHRAAGGVNQVTLSFDGLGLGVLVPIDIESLLVNWWVTIQSMKQEKYWYYGN